MPESAADHEADSPVSHTRGLHLRAVHKDKREADFVASDETIDSYDDIVEQSWKLGRFNKNPVILFAHNSRELPIGQAVQCGVEGGALECTIRFASEAANPLAEQVWQCVQEGVLRAVSVGFNPGSVRYEKRDGNEVCVLSDNELFEISVTPIGANPNALAKMRAKALAMRPPKESMSVKSDAEQKTGESTTQAATPDAAKAADLERQLLELKARLDEGEKTREAEKKLNAEEQKRLREEAEAAKSKALDAEVLGLVGKRIWPFEVETMTELAKLSRPLFDKTIAQRGGNMEAIFKQAFPDQGLAQRNASGEGAADLASVVAKAALEAGSSKGGGDLASLVAAEAEGD